MSTTLRLSMLEDRVPHSRFDVQDAWRLTLAPKAIGMDNARSVRGFTTRFQISWFVCKVDRKQKIGAHMVSIRSRKPPLVILH